MAKFLHFLLFFIEVTMSLYSSEAQNTQQDYLDAHNAARAQVGVGPMTWDDNVAAFAQKYAEQRIGDCNLVHSTDRPYGENLAKGTGDFTGKEAVDLWVDEKGNYDPKSNSCTGGRVCGHYTQVVWRKSVRLGCARVQCNDGWWFVSCNYDPPGNYIGQRPYYNHTQHFKKDCLHAHNAARAQVGVGPMTWDDNVAAFAQKYAEQRRIGDCDLVHSSNRPYGENLAKGSGDFSGRAAVDLWVDEKINYDPNSNSCTGETCHHYTQVVWRNSVRLGCARVQCNDGWWFVSCNYDPAGNIVGQLRPY